MRKLSIKKKRARRVRKKISGTSKKPRLSVFRSCKHVYVQAIDDEDRVTLASSSDTSLKAKKAKNKTEIASLVGADIGKKLLRKKIKTVVFDRAGYRYHGRIKALADAVRKSGIKF